MIAAKELRWWLWRGLPWWDLRLIKHNAKVGVAGGEGRGSVIMLVSSWRKGWCPSCGSWHNPRFLCLIQGTRPTSVFYNGGYQKSYIACWPWLLELILVYRMSTVLQRSAFWLTWDAVCLCLTACQTVFVLWKQVEMGCGCNRGVVVITSSCCQ